MKETRGRFQKLAHFGLRIIAKQLGMSVEVFDTELTVSRQKCDENEACILSKDSGSTCN